MPQEERARKRRRPAYGDGSERLEFQAGKVFSPAEAKADDLREDLDSARYKAQKGQAGTRRYWRRSE